MLTKFKDTIIELNKNLIENLIKYVNQELKTPPHSKISNTLDNNFVSEICNILGGNSDSKEEISAYLDDFFHFIWLKFDKPIIDNFGKTFFRSLTPQLQLKLLCAFAAEIIRYNYKIIYYYALLRVPHDINLILELELLVQKYIYLPQNAKACQGDLLLTMIRNLSEPPSNELSTIGIILQCYSLNMIEEGDYGLERFSDEFKDYLYERAWELKGRPRGNH